jgi:hypothetical protein
MTDNHWFDALNKMLVRDSPRRSILGATAAAVAGFVRNDVLPASAKDRKKKQQQNKKK